MEIGPVAAQEWPWLLTRSVATGWEQLTPVQQAATTPAVFARRVEHMLRLALGLPGGAALVARERGEPVGYVVVTAAPDELTGMPCGLLADIWVEPGRRGRGIGHRLTAAGEAHCRALGLPMVRRVVAAHNRASLEHALADGCQVERLTLVKVL